MTKSVGRCYNEALQTSWDKDAVPPVTYAGLLLLVDWLSYKYRVVLPGSCRWVVEWRIDGRPVGSFGSWMEGAGARFTGYEFARMEW